MWKDRNSEDIPSDQTATLKCRLTPRSKRRRWEEEERRSLEVVGNLQREGD